jgi:hypothetical protein
MALAAIAFAGALPGQKPAESPKESVPLPQHLQERLEELGKGARGARGLRGVRLELQFTPKPTPRRPSPPKPAKQEPTQEAAAAADALWGQSWWLRLDLEYPGLMRAEFRNQAKGPFEFCWLLTSKGQFHSEVDGSHLELRGEAAEQIEELFALGAAICHWDLLAPDALEESEGRCVSRSRLAGRSVQVSRSSIGKHPRWQIGAQSYAIEKPAHAIEDPASPKTKDLPKGLPALFHSELGSWRLLRFEAGLRFVATRFDPGHVPGKALQELRPGTLPQNFDRPKLERQDELWLLELEDPGDWQGRMARLSELGMALYKLGQMPAGLPVYTSTGKMRICYRPRPGKQPAAPEGFRLRKQGPGIAVVLHARRPLAGAEKELATQLLAYLRRMGRRPAGPLLLRPFVTPGDPSPAKGQDVLIRAELRIRN